jgi:hypothetical protein
MASEGRAWALTLSKDCTWPDATTVDVMALTFRDWDVMALTFRDWDTMTLPA